LSGSPSDEDDGGEEKAGDDGWWRIEQTSTLLKAYLLLGLANPSWH